MTLTVGQLNKYLKLDQKGKIMAEYVWIDAAGETRSKSRVSVVLCPAHHVDATMGAKIDLPPPSQRRHCSRLEPRILPWALGCQGAAVAVAVVGGCQLQRHCNRARRCCA